MKKIKIKVVSRNQRTDLVAQDNGATATFEKNQANRLILLEMMALATQDLVQLEQRSHLLLEQGEENQFCHPFE